MSSCCFYSLYISANAISPWLFISLFTVICVNITSTASLCMSCKNIFLLPSAYELGIIFLPSELNLKALNNFSCVGPSWHCVCVFTLLIFQIYCFYLSLILICFYLVWLLHVLIFNHFSGPSFSMVASSWSFWSWFFKDVVTCIILPFWWVLIFIFIFFDAFFLFSNFSDVIVVLVFNTWRRARQLHHWKWRRGRKHRRR